MMEHGVRAIRLVSSDEPAAALGFSAPNDAFRGFCRSLGITPVRKKPNFFDPKLVRVRLDQAQGLPAATDVNPSEDDLVEARRARRAAR